MALNTQRIMEMAVHNDFEGITALCKQDILETAAKQKGGASLVKRTKKAQSYMRGLDDGKLSNCGAAIVNYDGREYQQFSNSYSLVLLNEPMEGLPQATGEPLKTEMFFEQMAYCSEIPLDVPQIKAYLAECKAIRKDINAGIRTKAIKPYKIGNVYYNPQLLLDVMEVLGGNITFYQNNDKPLLQGYLKSENGLALVLPVRYKEEAAA